MNYIQNYHKSSAINFHFILYKITLMNALNTLHDEALLKKFVCALIFCLFA